MMELKVQRQKQYNEELEKEKKEQEKRAKDYFKKISGGDGNMLWHMRYDFYKFAEKRGGAWAFVAKTVKERNDQIEKEMEAKKA